jgi:predicted HicB family RNase H-like nuclease
MKFDPESYTITIRKEEDDGEIQYVGRVAEFPNISTFEDTFEAAHTLVLDSIQALKKISDETQMEFPLPYPAPSDEFSGRVTLRLSKSLHAKVSRLAAQEDISVNQYLVTAVATYVGEVNGISRVVSGAVNLLGHIVTNALANVSDWKVASFLTNNVMTPANLTIPKVDRLGQRFLPYTTLQYTGETK